MILYIILHIKLYYIILYYITVYYIILYYITIYYIILYFITVYYIILQYIILLYHCIIYIYCNPKIYRKVENLGMLETQLSASFWVYKGHQKENKHLYDLWILKP